MKTEFIVRKDGNSRLILIFAGWNTDAQLYREIQIPGWDTLVAFDYDGEQLPTDLLNGYTTVYLFAWSLGVAASLHYLDNSCITRRIAINGTPFPVSDKYGIPADVFNGTEETLNDRNLYKFRLRMAGGKSALKNLLPLLSQNPDIDNLKSQLRMFATISNKRNADETIIWDRVFISDNDKIFPSENQVSAWRKESVLETINISGPHYLDIHRIVSSVVPNLDKVARSFSASDETYDAHAIAQHKIAKQLLFMIPEPHHRPLRILEIGPGSGVFSRLYSEILKPESITYIDLYPIKKQNLAPQESYHVGDAEQFIADTDEKWDLILSASTIQWFTNLPQFFRNAKACLNPGGALCCSTFLPDNLKELRSARPSTLLYYSADKLTAMLQSVFEDIRSETLSVDVEFRNAREALEHLKSTGVGRAHNNEPSAKEYVKSGTALSALSSNPVLHYSAFLFTAK